ncbi:DUF84 domain-containing protein [Pueribacillus theae]|uniref:Probable inosine/xanthosine triphosphatase n=1 Tax=Pueribacillus theae TaxID=2171751 RepID=A0A2U1JX09_9BACI|nr:DUF84 family protein [Pueribacillus theae]PWA09484.1 DUF84 domain-containing protein [Pueribacillus theae]
MNVAVGSKNRAKLLAVERIASDMGMNVFVHPVPSGVSPQPLSDNETKEGALNRARGALQHPKCSIGIGLEGGVDKLENQWFVCNWGALVDAGGIEIVSSGARFLLPKAVCCELVKGKELSTVMDEFAGKKNIGQSEGAVGIFTNGLVTRSEMYEHLVKILFGQYLFYKKRF